MADGHATPDRVRFVMLPAWFVVMPDGKLRIATEAEAVRARQEATRS